MGRTVGAYQHPDLTERELRLVQALAMVGCPLEIIAQKIGMTKENLDKRMKRDPRIKLALESGKAESVSRAHTTLYEMAFKDKIPAMAIFWAKTRLGWREAKQEIEITHKAPTIKMNLGHKNKQIDIKEEIRKFIDQPQQEAENVVDAEIEETNE